jgi:hypothetical protein
MPAKGQYRLSEQQRPEAARLYVAEPYPSVRSLAELMGVSSAAVRAALEAAGVALRSRAEQRRLDAARGRAATPQSGSEEMELIDQVTPDRWRELYWGADSGFPPVKALAGRFGVDPSTLRARLRQAGITLRTRSEQARAEFRTGRRVAVGHGRGGLPKGTAPTWMHHLPPAKERQRRNRIAAAKRSRITLPCAWCGAPVERVPWRVRGAVACCGSHRAHYAMHRRWRGAEAARPLIVERLCAILLEESERHTYRQATRRGEALGAGEPEILESLQQLWRRLAKARGYRV